MLDDWRWTYFLEGARTCLPFAAVLYLGAVLLARRGARVPGLLGTVITLAFVSTSAVAARPISDLLGNWVAPDHLENAALALFILLAAGAFLPGQLPQAVALAIVGTVAFIVHPPNPGEPTLAFLTLAVAVPAGAFACAWLDARGAAVDRAIGLLGLSVFALYLAVPDTEEAFALVGAVTPALVVGLLPPRPRLGGAAVAATLVVMAWTAAVGSAGRGPAIVAAAASIGALCAIPAASVIAPRIGVALTSGRPRGIVLVGIHAVTVLAAARLLPRLVSEWWALLLAAGLITTQIGCILWAASPDVRRSLDSVE